MSRILVIYHSQEYGNTEAVAKLVAQGAGQVAGADVTMVNTNTDRDYDTERILGYDAVAIGSPDYGSTVAGTIKQVFDDLFILGRKGKEIGGKPCVTFMTHGGGGKGATQLQNMAERRGFEVLAPCYMCQGAPDAGDTEIIALGEKLAQAAG